MSIKETVRRLVRENAGTSYYWKLGQVVKHPDGYNVRIDSGCYLDPTYGRVSNWWTWTVLDKNNKPTKEKDKGYGW